MESSHGGILQYRLYGCIKDLQKQTKRKKEKRAPQKKVNRRNRSGNRKRMEKESHGQSHQSHNWKNWRRPLLAKGSDRRGGFVKQRLIVVDEDEAISQRNSSAKGRLILV
ncbi:uncharacterized protein LOC123707646 [Pieris brassicae]|uniref:uncharacterized protein LOC123707646 n=1 Tax=Pieris brassicae TaxID=7116 RepID=UPI001E6625F7|nr:uncharacterized protein LOC123707646 [Pieris brassicae]